MSYLWQGTSVSREEVLTSFKNFTDTYSSYDSALWDPHLWIQIFDSLSKALNDSSSNASLRFEKNINRLTPELKLEYEAARGELVSFLEGSSLKKKVSRELGGERLRDFHRRDMKSPIFEGWLPLGVLFHITPGNALSLPFLTFVEGLLAGNLNIVKANTNSFDFFNLVLDLLIDLHPKAKGILPFCILLNVDASDSTILDAIYPNCDGVSAWGSESSLEKIYSKVPPHCRWIPWGHKISFQFIAKERSHDFKLVSKVVDDVCMFDQQACSSPQILYIEDADTELLNVWGQKIQSELLTRSPMKNLPSDPEEAEKQKTKALLLAHSAFEKSQGRSEATFYGDVWVDPDPTPKASPLYRTLWVKPLSLKNFKTMLLPMRRYLQTVGLASVTNRIAEVTRALVRVGADRIRPIGRMHDGYPGEAHDGVYALTRFMRRASFEGDESFENVFTLNEIAPREMSGSSLEINSKILKKEDWSNSLFSEEDKDLFFKSGGSSGAFKVSLFSYEDYHLLMKQASKGLMAAGLDPKSDKCMNLFYGGALYGGFLSFFTILEFLEAKQFPMIAYPDYTFVADTILEHKVNVLLGMPSYFFSLFEHEADKMRKAKIDKIYYGGEALSKAQRESLKKDFGVKVVRSATYGSVDLGPLGYQCLETEGGVHHLHSDVLDLNILKMDSDEPTTSETGRLIFRSKVRSSLSQPYEIGDLGRWIEKPCNCGRTDPLFELQGRMGDIFRVGGSFINYQKIEKIIRDDFAYNGELQLRISKNEWRDVLSVFLDSSKISKSKELLETCILEHYPDLRELVNEKVVQLKVEFCTHDTFLTTSQSGKLRHIVDTRIIL